MNCSSFDCTGRHGAMLLERAIAKKSSGNLTLLLRKIWATFFYCFGTNMAALSRAWGQNLKFGDFTLFLEEYGKEIDRFG